jgi:membrane-associated phospholipid phosphatase
VVRELITLLTGVGGVWTYPAMGLFAFFESAAFVGLVIPGETRRGPRRMVAVAAAAAALTIGMGRLYLGAHWASDVVRGWLIGTLWLVVCLTMARGAAIRHPLTTAPEPASPVPTRRSPVT